MNQFSSSCPLTQFEGFILLDEFGDSSSTPISTPCRQREDIQLATGVLRRRSNKLQGLLTTTGW